MTTDDDYLSFAEKVACAGTRRNLKAKADLFLDAGEELQRECILLDSRFRVPSLLRTEKAIFDSDLEETSCVHTHAWKTGRDEGDDERSRRSNPARRFEWDEAGRANHQRQCGPRDWTRPEVPTTEGTLDA